MLHRDTQTVAITLKETRYVTKAPEPSPCFWGEATETLRELFATGTKDVRCPSWSCCCCCCCAPSSWDASCAISFLCPVSSRERSKPLGKMSTEKLQVDVYAVDSGALDLTRLSTSLTTLCGHRLWQNGAPLRLSWAADSSALVFCNYERVLVMMTLDSPPSGPCLWLPGRDRGHLRRLVRRLSGHQTLC